MGKTISDYDAILRHYNQGRTSWELAEWAHEEDILRMQNVLRLIIPRDLTKQNEVAVVGETALLWYQILHNVGPVWPFVRKTNVHIHVCGRNGSSRFRFERFVKRCIREIIRHDEKISWSSKSVDEFVDNNGKYAEVWYVKVKRFPKVFSFVQCPGIGSVQDSANLSCVNVTRVVYHIHRNRYEMKMDIVNDINHCKAKVACEIGFRIKGCPTHSEIVKIERRMTMMKRYSERGFKFHNGKGLVFA